MNLVIDIGNTKVKVGVFEQNTLLYNKSIIMTDFSKYFTKIAGNYKISSAIISSVGKLKHEIYEIISPSIDILLLNHKTSLPFTNSYSTPESLGVDRIALMAAAVSNYPNKNVLVIDAGSCITFDLINDKKNYFGGFISPGIEMRYKSLNLFTEKLPKLSPIMNIPKVGNSTQNAIHIGVLNGVIQEIEGVIEQFKAKNKELTVVLTGGDTIFLAKNIKSTIFANPNFLLEGLNKILIFNKHL